MSDTFHINTLPKNTLLLAEKLQKEWSDENSATLIKPWNNFYLSGGTALSLQLGHRESEDLDFFSQEDFDPSKIQTQLEKFNKLTDLELADGTLNTYIDGVKLQFLRYPYPLLEPFDDWNNFKISSVIDIACTKLHTISMRGSKKDFIDIYFILQNYPLDFIFQKLKEKYKDSDFNYIHILKSLTYFEDADIQPSPRMHMDVNWEEIKKEIVVRVKSI